MSATEVLSESTVKIFVIEEGRSVIEIVTS